MEFPQSQACLWLPSNSVLQRMRARDMSILVSWLRNSVAGIQSQNGRSRQSREWIIFTGSCGRLLFRSRRIFEMNADILGSGYQKSGRILQDDLLYTLSVFITEPITWIKKFEWRDLTEMESLYSFLPKLLYSLTDPSLRHWYSVEIHWGCYGYRVYRSPVQILLGRRLRVLWGYQAMGRGVREESHGPSGFKQEDCRWDDCAHSLLHS